MALHPNPLSRIYLDGVITTRPDHAAWRSQYIGDSLFPIKEVPAYKLAWDEIQSENNLGGFYAINGRPIPGSDMKFKEHFQELTNVMSARVMEPQDVMYLREPGEPTPGTASYNMKAQAQAKITKFIGDCDNEVDAMVEYMRLGALQGSIVWPPKDAAGNAIAVPMPQWGDIQMTINFPIRSTFNQDGTTLVGYSSRNGTQVAWSDAANSNPIYDLEVIAELIMETIGVDAHGSRIIMGGGLLSRLAFNESIISWVKGLESGVKYIAVEELKGFIKTKIGYTIQEYNARWTYRTNHHSNEGPTVNSVPFLGRNRMIILPPGVDLGYTASGPSPDGEYRSGKYSWVAQDKEPPWETRIGEGHVCFPVFKAADSVFLFDPMD
jgi:hypothetical protein